MSNSRYVNEPTIGKSVNQVPSRTTGDTTQESESAREPKEPAVDRSVAQPLPGKEPEEVKEKASASKEEEAAALTKHSKSGKVFTQNKAKVSEAPAELTDEDLDAQDPNDVDDGL